MPSKKVLVTGGSGFIAKHIIRELLDQGYAVRATVRSPQRQAQIEALFPDADLEFASVDLTSDQGWDAALTGIDVLMHTASPFPIGAPKDPQELIRPAVDGTLRALRAARAAGVRRVVLTSSCVAIYKSASKAPAARSTRADWTDPNGPRTTPYEASKTLAERAAWDFVAEHPEMVLTTINPGLVAGPPMDEHYGTSLQQIEAFLTGGVPMCAQMNVPLVDVRDVARMHVGALSADGAEGQRFPSIVDAPDMVQIAQVLHEAYPERKIPVRTAPNWLVRLMGKVNPLMGTIASNLDWNLDVDGSDAERVFDFTYIPSREALLASAQYLTEHGK